MPNGRARKILRRSGYITELDTEFSVAGLRKAWVRLRDSNKRKAVKLSSIRVALPKADTLSILLTDEWNIKRLYNALRTSGIVVMRWHKLQGKISIEGRKIRQNDETPERAALRKYMARMKRKYGAGTPKYYRHIRNLAGKAGIRFKRKSKSGEAISPVGMNLQIANAMVAALKRGNKVLAKAVKYTPKT